MLVVDVTHLRVGRARSPKKQGGGGFCWLALVNRCGGVWGPMRSGTDVDELAWSGVNGIDWHGVSFGWERMDWAGRGVRSEWAWPLSTPAQGLVPQACHSLAPTRRDGSPLGFRRPAVDAPLGGTARVRWSNRYAPPTIRAIAPGRVPAWPAAAPAPAPSVPVVG